MAMMLFGMAHTSVAQVTDIDGHVYKTVRIGAHEWMAENLSVSHYRNGDPIPQIQEKKEWSNATTGAWCYYENNPDNGKIYGQLYNWRVLTDKRGIAPAGWHVPSPAERGELVGFLGGEEIAAAKMKAGRLWGAPNTKATNESGFAALPGGCRDSDLTFKYIGQEGYFWIEPHLWERTATIEVTLPFLSLGDRCSLGRVLDFAFGMSIRCVKDHDDSF
jgi:uncharacterized protein (TIGR02145 family)